MSTMADLQIAAGELCRARPAEAAGPATPPGPAAGRTEVSGALSLGKEWAPLTFPAEAAEWIRMNVWTPPMRKTFAEVPGFYMVCACQGGTTSWCLNGRCDRCHRAEPLVSYETLVCRRGGNHPAYFLHPFTHPTMSATGAHHEQAAMVWLADRRCRWVCPHVCHSAPAAPEQLDLLGGAA